MDFQLIQISDNVYYISDSTNVGVIFEQVQERINIYLIDTPATADKTEKLLKVLNDFCTVQLKQAWTVKAIIVTHAHADHVSCCAEIKAKTGCEIWCTQDENGNLENPIYEQAIISGGWPLPEIQIPFYQAEKITDAKIINERSKILLCDGTELTFVPLYGHHFGMIGVLVKTVTGNSVFYAADGIFGRNHMKKYWIPFMLDIGSFKESLKKIVSLNADFLLPSHGNLTKGEKIEALAELNEFAILTTEKRICNILKNPCTAENLLKIIFDEDKIPCRLGQYILIGCTIRSYLSYLYRTEKIRYFFKENLMYWQAN